MNSTKLHVRVQALKQKIAQLLVGYREQQELIQQLQKKNEQLIQQLPGKTETMHDFLGRLEIDTIAKKDGKLKNWEVRLDHYISDIDKSIAYLETIQ